MSTQKVQLKFKQYYLDILGCCLVLNLIVDLRIKFNYAVRKVCKTDAPRINKSTIKLRTFERKEPLILNYFEAAVTKENTTPVLRIRKQHFNLQTLTKFGQNPQTKQNCNSSKENHWCQKTFLCGGASVSTQHVGDAIFDVEPSVLFTAVSRTVIIRYVTPVIPESITGL